MTTAKQPGKPMTDDERSRVASCLAASGLLISPSSVERVESDGWCVFFAGDNAGCVWVRPDTRRAIKEALNV